MDQLIKCTSRLSMAFAVALIASCAGPEGPAGPAGASGATGAPGATGSVGPAGAAGTDGTAGTAGTDGVDGQSCTVANYDGGVTVTCPGSAAVNVPNGTNGASCTVTNIDGGVSVACPGSSPVTVLNGTSPSHKPMVEQCLVCHGPGAIAPVTLMHNGAKGLSPIAGLKVKVLSVSGTAPIEVHFLVTDDRDNPVDLAGKYSYNTAFTPSFSLSRVETVALSDGGTQVLPYKVLTKSGSLSNATAAPDPAAVTVINPTAFTPTWPIPTAGVPATDAAVKGLLVENGTRAGDYTYTFPTGGYSQVLATSGRDSGKYVTTVVPAVDYDSAKRDNTHTVWIQAARQWDLVNTSNLQTFKPTDTEYNFIPSGTGTVLPRRIVSQAACDKCHNGFKRDLNPNLTLATVNGFHGGGRVEAPFCNVCHNPDRTSNPAANSAVFVHRLHGAHKLVANPDGGVPPDAFHGIQVGYPQDIRNCDTCHAGATNGWQASIPSLQVCGSCHDGVNFAASASLTNCTNPPKVDADGRFVPCNHQGGAQADNTNCTVCHGGPTSPKPLALSHLAVLPPDPRAVQPLALSDGGVRWANPDGGASSANVNAAWIAAANDVPAGAYVTKYVIQSVGLSSAGHPQMVFKLQQSLDGTAAFTDVDFGTASSSNTELIPGFVGGPSAYFAWSVPQDGIAAPADFNASASCYIRNAWNGTATSGTGACTLSAKDGTGHYTVEMTNVNMPTEAKMLTGGMGYTYNISSARPLTQINLGNYPFTASTGIGGLIVAAANVSKVATNFTARRVIVETARCNNCHAQLGVGPTFHAGQRNDAPTCTFCHNPNRTSTAWSANSKDFIHSIHGGRIRTVPFNWQALSESDNFSEVEFPSNINNCEACHAPNTFDFTIASTTTALPNMLASTVGVGKYNRDPVTNPTGWFKLPPANYVLADNVYNYGTGFSFNATTKVITPAAGTTLVKSPITAACSACHDAPASIAHMEAQGGAFYRPRSEVF